MKQTDEEKDEFDRLVEKANIATDAAAERKRRLSAFLADVDELLSHGVRLIPLPRAEANDDH